MEDPDNCSGDSTSAPYWYHIKSDSQYSKELYSTFLAARMSKQRVSFYVAGCTDGTTGFPIVLHGNIHD